MTTGAVIVGAAETDEIGVVPTKSEFELHLEAARRAMRDAGLDASEIDGIATTHSPGPVQVSHALGIEPNWLDSTNVGGTSYLLHVRHAAAAIAAGLCHTVLITHGESGRSRVGSTSLVMDSDAIIGQFERPYGLAGPATMLTLPAMRFMAETGLTAEQLASVPVAQRKWARQNPRAGRQELITVDDVLNSRMIAYPFHLLECCLVTDGGGALIVTSKERAERLETGHRGVHILGTGEASEAPMISMIEDMTRSRAFRMSSQRAFADAGIRHTDVDHLMIYDAFAHLPIYGLEDMGFVGRGEAGAFIAEGNTSPGGPLPMNTNGGGLAYTHTGMYGMFAILEAVRQIRGEAAAQVDEVDVSVVLGNGNMFASAGTLVLGSSDTVSR